MDHSDYFSGYDNDKPIVLLEDWSVIPVHSPFGQGPFQAPETKKMALYGKVYNHPKFEDGEYAQTTTPLASAGLEVETINSIYVLGKMNKNYAMWCDNKGFSIDPSNPFVDKT